MKYILSIKRVWRAVGKPLSTFPRACLVCLAENWDNKKGRPKSAFVGNQPLSNTHDNVLVFYLELVFFRDNG